MYIIHLFNSIYIFNIYISILPIYGPRKKTMTGVDVLTTKHRTLRGGCLGADDGVCIGDSPEGVAVEKGSLSLKNA